MRKDTLHKNVCVGSENLEWYSFSTFRMAFVKIKFSLCMCNDFNSGQELISIICAFCMPEGYLYCNKHGA